MASFICISSADLKNWTDHGVVFRVPRDASWASRSWAPSVAERNGTVYLYFANGASNIGVATADNPVGPFTDPIGRSLINASTPDSAGNLVITFRMSTDLSGLSYFIRQSRDLSAWTDIGWPVETIEENETTKELKITTKLSKASPLFQSIQLNLD